MKKFLTFVVALAMVIPTMAIGRNDGSTKANAIDFDWEAPMTHTSGTKWYRVDLAPLYEEETPALNLFLANKDAFNDTHTSLKATVAGQTDEKSFTIHPKQQRVWSANATMLVRLKQKEIYLTLTSDGTVMMSARVFEAEDLDETCTDALSFSWTTGITKPAGVPVWYKVNIKEAKANTAQDVCVVVTNNGTKPLTLQAGQSLDCPSSGVTTRTIELGAGQTLRDTIPNSMLNGVAFDELYVRLENDQPITVTAEYANRPLIPVMPSDPMGVVYTEKVVPDTSLHTSDVTTLLAGQTYYLKYDVAKLNALKKYEPEFTFRNIGSAEATIDRKMAFEVPAYSAQGNTLVLEGGEESIEVLTKNTLIGLDASYIYVKITPDQDIQLVSRFKHLREGKACKTNIDFDWVNGHTQSASTKLWYAVDVADARDNIEDIVVHLQNLGSKKASLDASVAFSCPYIDVQEMHHSIAAGATEVRTLGYSTYAMMTDTIWIGVETNQDIKFWATTKPAKTNEPDEACLNAVTFDWEQGVMQQAGDTVWYKISMDEVREKSAKFPTVFVQNLSSTEAAKITAELSLECPDSIANQKRSKTLAANESYSKQLSRNLFENIVQDTIYLKVITTQDISLQIRLTEEAEGASCSSAIPFNWVSGNTQAANANLWYSVDMREIMKNGNDIRLHVENKDNAECKGVAQILYECPTNEAPSSQNFKLGKYGTQSITVQNSAFEMLEDSSVYVNVQGTTSLRFWVEILPLKSFDTIYADGLTLIPLQWDTLYTQTVDTAWYIIPKSEIDKVRNLDEKVKPVAHLINLGAANTIKGEAAFAFPIGKKMMTKSQSLKAGQHYTDTVPAGTFDQFLKKDSIILRVTRPTGSADFQFRAELVKAFNGNTRNDALPIRMGEQYTQGPNTEMWYKINTADWKKDKTLFNKRLFVQTKNAGKGDAEVTVSAYEGLLSEVDILEDYGLSDYRKRTIKKGENRSHDIPAQAVYGLGDVEMYVKVRTTDSLVFLSKFDGTYAPQAVDPKQAEAKLLAPNVEYVVPGDNQEHWYMVCLPYMQNNYIYTDGATLEYELNGKATIEATATFQDQMDCKMPVRKRTINKSGGYHKGSKPVRELIEKAIKKAGQTFDFSGTDPEFMDSLLHRYITKDSVTAYVRIKTDKDLKVKLNLVQITGDQCTNPMAFDWEHGNVNPAGADSWYHVKLDSLIVPGTCDLRLHVDNWGTTDDNIGADLYFDCNDPATVSKTYTLGANGKDSLDIDRDFLQQLGWADMIINYTSGQASHIWAELIPNKPRECDYDTITAYVCLGGSFTDTIKGNVYDPVDNYMTWNDTVAWQDGVTMRDSVTTFFIHTVTAPAVITVDSMKKLDAAPLLVQGMQLYVDASNAALMTYYQNIGLAEDTVITVDTVYWAKPVYKANGDLDIKKEDPLDLTSFYTKNDTQDTLLLVIKGGCETVLRQDVVFPIQDYKYATKNDTICPPVPAQNPDTIAWQVLVADTLGRDRQIDTIVTYVARTLPTLYTETQLLAKPIVANGAAIDTTFTLRSLKQQFEDDADELTMKVTDAKWQVLDGATWQDMPYTVSTSATSLAMRYVITTECGDVLNSDNINYTLAGTCEHDTVFMTTPVVSCGTYHWTMDDQDYTISGKYYYDDGPLTPGSACNQYYELNLIINQPGDGEEYKTICDTELPYMWKGVARLTAGDHQFDTLTVAGCDSTVTLHLTVLSSTTGVVNKTICDSELPYTWKGIVCPAANTYTFDTLNVAGCDSTITLNLTVLSSTTGVVNKTICDSELPYTWKGIVCPAANTYTFDTLNVAGCDSTITLNLTVLSSTTGDEYVSICDNELPYTWKGINCPAAGTYTFDTLNVAGCDSTITLHLTVNPTYTIPETVTKCNLYTWRGVTYTTSGIYYDSLTTVAGCDSVYVLDLTINVPYQSSLSLVHKFGDRLIMIDRNEINAMPGWYLDSLDIEHPEYVTWYEIDPAGNERVCGTGYYYNLASGEPLPTGYTYYAVVNIPGSGVSCGAQGTTVQYTIPTHAAAPALVPTLARPGENIRVINLDPETETTVRIYTAEGVLMGTYTVQGESTYTITAARENGFYLVELVNDSMKSTLRYIVK
ncbi:MAG: hypothetical protein IKG86_02025 [Paludibacteraceae bacterium]|nr:hypothetical protein [Paludibacteraceae bacterium]